MPGCSNKIPFLSLNNSTSCCSNGNQEQYDENERGWYNQNYYYGRQPYWYQYGGYY